LFASMPSGRALSSSRSKSSTGQVRL